MVTFHVLMDTWDNGEESIDILLKMCKCWPILRTSVTSYCPVCGWGHEWMFMRAECMLTWVSPVVFYSKFQHHQHKQLRHGCSSDVSHHLCGIKRFSTGTRQFIWVAGVTIWCQAISPESNEESGPTCWDRKVRLLCSTKHFWIGFAQLGIHVSWVKVPKSPSCVNNWLTIYNSETDVTFIKFT